MSNKISAKQSVSFLLFALCCIGMFLPVMSGNSDLHFSISAAEYFLLTPLGVVVVAVPWIVAIVSLFKLPSAVKCTLYAFLGVAFWVLFKHCVVSSVDVVRSVGMLNFKVEWGMYVFPLCITLKILWAFLTELLPISKILNAMGLEITKE